MTAIPGKPLWTRANHTHTSPDRSTHKSQYTQPDPVPPTHKENLPFFSLLFLCVCGQTPQWALKGPTLFFFLLGRLSTTPYNIEDTQKKGVSKKGTIIAPRRMLFWVLIGLSEESMNKGGEIQDKKMTSHCKWNDKQVEA